MNAPQLENFASAIHRSLIAPRIILFGSRLLGTQRTDSDIDLVVVSASFHRVGLYERHKLVEQAVAELNWQSDLILRTPAEWEAGGFLREMIQSQLNAPDEWRRLFDAKGRKIGYRDVLAARSGFDLTPADSMAGPSTPGSLAGTSNFGPVAAKATLDPVQA